MAREFVKLDAAGYNLKARLSRAVYDSFKTLVSDERQRGNLGL